MSRDSVTNSEACSDCGHPVPLAWQTCPHCARPQLFPNVRLANHKVERDKLEQRYQDAQVDAKGRGCSDQVAAFEAECSTSKAVFRCELLRLHAEIASGTDLYKPFRDIERLRLRYERPAGFDWPKLRIQAERELLGKDEHLGNVHYACLSLNGEGIISYGDVTVALSEPMIAHRASCIEGNSAHLFAKHGSLARILRSNWEMRAKLCVAKVSSNISPDAKSDDFPGLVVKNGVLSNDDDFVEVIIFDTMTAATFEAVTIERSFLSQSNRNSVYWEAVNEKLAKHGVRATET